jgi:hypothetical protein
MPAKAILMVEPTTFRYNDETAKSNFFQQTDDDFDNNKVLSEFYRFVETIEKAGVTVYVKKHPATQVMPDAVFPNNWISFLPGGIVVIYPMMAASRRIEKDRSIIHEAATATSYREKKIIDLSYFEKQNKFLEGTGSIVFDHEAQIAFASLSPRTDQHILELLCSEINYRPFLFSSYDRMHRLIYHTNVMLTITSRCAIACLESITDKKKCNELVNALTTGNRVLIAISTDQMEAFAGNMLELEGRNGESLLVMSESAFCSLNKKQRSDLEKLHTLLHEDLSVIEKNGGGSARCMMAEIFI